MKWGVPWKLISCVILRCSEKNDRKWAILWLKTSWLLGYAFGGPVFTCSEIIATAAKIMLNQFIVLGTSFLCLWIRMLFLANLSQENADSCETIAPKYMHSHVHLC